MAWSQVNQNQGDKCTAAVYHRGPFKAPAKNTIAFNTGQRKPGNGPMLIGDRQANKNLEVAPSQRLLRQGGISAREY